MTDRRPDDDPESPGEPSDGHTPSTPDQTASTSSNDGEQTATATNESSETRSSERATETRSPVGAIGDRLQSVTLGQAVIAITALAVLARLIGLGARPMHYDEGRVGYWILHYLDSGSFAYRHGIHGPFVQHANRWLFGIVGANDFTARLPVALAGGLLPLVALAFREHLEKREVVAVALFLGFNSILVYYSRFMRSDMLLAAFMLATLGLLVRLYDTRDPRYLYGAAVLGALGFATKENAIVYVLTWVGATALLADQALYRPRSDRSGLAVARARLSSLRDSRVGYFLLHLLGAVVVFLLVLVFMYADRGAGMAGIERPAVPPAEGAVGFWDALSNPLQFPGYASDTLSGAANEALRWGGRTGAGEDDLLGTYVSNIGTDLKVLSSNAPILLVFSVIGFVWERYVRSRSRNLVMFASYCGFVSVLGYPLADDIGSAHWLHVHSLVVLAIPAAVALGGVYQWGREAQADGDAIGRGAVAVVLVLAAGAGAVTLADDVYGDTTSSDNPLAQYAQPQSEFRVAFDGVGTIADGNGNETDVVMYTGESFTGEHSLVGPPEDDLHDFVLRPSCTKTEWYNAIPLNWYLVTSDANVHCETNPDQLAEFATSQEPPMIVTREPDASVPSERLSADYTARTFEMYQFGHTVEIYLHDDWVDRVRGWEALPAPET